MLVQHASNNATVNYSDRRDVQAMNEGINVSADFGTGENNKESKETQNRV